MATSPPTHRAAPTRCRASVLTAVSWSALPPAWPASASGTSAPIARKAAVLRPLRVSETAATVVATATRSEEMSATRSASSDQAKVCSCDQNSGLDSGVPAASAKPRTTPATPATTHTTPDQSASRPARSIVGEACVADPLGPGTSQAATTSSPMVTEAARSWATRSSGRAQRTAAPASEMPATGASAAPPTAMATTQAMSATTASPSRAARPGCGGRWPAPGPGSRRGGRRHASRVRTAPGRSGRGNAGRPSSVALRMQQLRAIVAWTKQPLSGSAV